MKPHITVERVDVYPAVNSHRVSYKWVNFEKNLFPYFILVD